MKRAGNTLENSPPHKKVNNGGSLSFLEDLGNDIWSHLSLFLTPSNLLLLRLNRRLRIQIEEILQNKISQLLPMQHFDFGDSNTEPEQMKTVFDRLSAVEKMRQETNLKWTLIWNNTDKHNRQELQPIPWDPSILYRIRGYHYGGGVLELLLLKEKKKLMTPKDMKITSVSFHKERREMAVLVKKTEEQKVVIRTLNLGDDGTLQFSSFELPLKNYPYPEMLHRYTDEHFFIRSDNELVIVSPQTGEFLETVKFAPKQFSRTDDTETLTGLDGDEINVFQMEISPDCSYIAAAWNKRKNDETAYLARYNLASREFKKMIRWNQAIGISDVDVGPKLIEFISNETLQITSDGDTTGIILVDMQTKRCAQSAHSDYMSQTMRRMWKKEEKMVNIDNSELDYEFKRITEDIFTVYKWVSRSQPPEGVKPPLDPISVYSLKKGKLFEFEGMRVLHGYESEKFSYFHLHSKDYFYERQYPDYFFILTSSFDPK